MRSAISTSAEHARRRKVSRVAAIVSGACPSNRLQSRATSASSASCGTTASRYPIGSNDSAVGISASNNIRFTQLTPSVAQSRRRLAAERQLPRLRAIGTPNRAPEAARRMSQAFAMASPAPTATPSTTAMLGTCRRSSPSIKLSSFAS